MHPFLIRNCNFKYIEIYTYHRYIVYRGADKSLARLGKKQASASVRMA